ncbi:MAG: extracellular solute-binding protein [Thaumarchaeota archaeon]|nr:extracellular solute-binding protein [Nitrososphaerota archaeon]
MAAKKEGKVVVMSQFGKSTYSELINAFQQKYGVAVEYQEFNTMDILPRLTAEYSAGKYNWDVAQMSVPFPLDMIKDQGLLLQYRPEAAKGYGKEQTNPLGMYTANIFSTFGFAYNTKKISREEIQKLDLDTLATDLKWKGRLAARDLSGSGVGILIGLYKEWGEEKLTKWLKNLAKQNIFIHSDDGVLAESLAKGEYDGILNINTAKVVTMKNEGSPVDYSFELRGHQFASFFGVGIFEKAPHPNTAKLFTEYILSNEGATILGKVQPVATPGVKGAIPELGGEKRGNVVILDSNLILTKMGYIQDLWKKAKAEAGS